MAASADNVSLHRQPSENAEPQLETWCATGMSQQGNSRAGNSTEQGEVKSYRVIENKKQQLQLQV